MNSNDIHVNATELHLDGVNQGLSDADCQSPRAQLTRGQQLPLEANDRDETLPVLFRPRLRFVEHCD